MVLSPRSKFPNQRPQCVIVRHHRSFPPGGVGGGGGGGRGGGVGGGGGRPTHIDDCKRTELERKLWAEFQRASAHRDPAEENRRWLIRRPRAQDPH